MEDGALMAMVHVPLGAYVDYESRGFKAPCVPSRCLSVPELTVGLCKRESNQPRPGVAPGCPQPMLRAQPCVCGAERVRGRDANMPKSICMGKQRPLQNDVLEIGS